MAESSTKIVLTAEDRTGGALASVTRGLGSMQAEALRASAALSAIGFTAAAAGATAYVRSIINTADETQKLSQRIGIATRDIAGWKLAADLSGASLESVAKGIKGLSTYSAEYGDTLRQVGIDTRDPQKALTQLADLFAALPDGLQKTALATTLFGKAGLDMIPMLNQGSRALEEQRKKAEEYGRKMAEIGPDAEKFNDNLEETAFYAKAAGMNIATYFMSGLTGLSKLLVDVAKGGDDAYNALEWLWGERIAKGAALLHSERFGKGLKRESGDKIGGGAGGMSLADEEALAAKNIAGLQAAELIKKAKEKAEKMTAKVQGPIDVFGSGTYITRDKATAESIRASFEFENWAQGELAKEAQALEEKARKMDEAHQARMEAYRIETEGEEAQRLATGKLNAELAKQKDMAQDLGLTFASAFEDAIVGGKGLQSILRGLAQDVQRIFVRKTVTEPAANFLSSMFKDFLPKFAGGGDHSGGLRLVGENGPELEATGPARIFSASQTRDMLAGSGGGGGAQTVRVEVVNPPGRPAEVASASPRFDAEGLVVRVVLRDLASGGPIRGAMAGQFGLNAAAGGY